MQRDKRWNVAPSDPQAAELASRLRVSPLIAQVLLNRGLRECDDCRQFLSPSLKTLHDPSRLPNLNRAAQRIAKAIRDRQKIVIYGDYDVDGITATAILWHAIRQLGGIVDSYIPHRIDEGYGLGSEAIAQLCDGEKPLIVSVDCGVTAVEPAKIAKERGVDLIITDHHDWRQSAPGETALPDCYTIVHPRLPGEGEAYPNPHLCGAGVAFKLAWGIGLAVSGNSRVSADFREFLVNATALAALGTIADVVPLVGENRALAHFGLKGLPATKLPGLRALIDSAGLSGQALDSFHVGFLLAPRLNASGRMGHAQLAVEMLTSADEPKAKEIAAYLEQQNRARQTIEKQIFAQAVEQVTANGWDGDGQRGLVLAAEEWHPGVIGIVASRIVERYHRPAVMIALSNGHGQGSARSVSGFHLARALEACSECLEGHGGHEMAAGLKLQTSRIDDFRAAFCAEAQRRLTPEMLVPELRIDALADLQDITAALVVALDRLGPFGHGNRRPLLACRGLSVAAPARRVGRNAEHLQLLLRQGERNIKCIAFGRGEWADRLVPGVNVDLAAEPCINEFNGFSSVELEVKDLQWVGSGA
jgi:single-stranded-DNA-specific exonuclease